MAVSILFDLLGILSLKLKSLRKQEVVYSGLVLGFCPQKVECLGTT